MNDKNNFSGEERQKPRLQLKTIFYHNTFVLVFSFLCAIAIWFTLKTSGDLGPTIVYDVPINIQLSEAAQEEGIFVFSQSDKLADVTITGGSETISKVTEEGISVVAKLSPVSSKLVGNTMQTETVPVIASKKDNAVADYEVAAVTPKEITVIYDRYKEVSFTVENNMKYAAAANYYIATPEISETQVVVSGPESSVNKVSRVALDYEIADPLSESRSFSCALTAYDQNNKPMKLAELYLTLSVDTVDVSLDVLSKQQVALDVTTLGVPEGFGESRITIEPESIEIAGDLETVSQYKTITLPNAVDFSAVNTKNATFEMDIPMPAGVKNVSKVEKAKVVVNLNGFKETSVMTDSIKLVNVPDNKTVTLVTKSLQVDVVGSTAQIARITPGAVFGTIDMAKLTGKNGNIEVPVTVSISGLTSCWIYGQYTVHVNVQDKVEEIAASPAP